MTEENFKLISDHLEGRSSPEGVDDLNRLLENDSEARRRYRDLAALEEGLRDFAISNSNVIDELHLVNTSSQTGMADKQSFSNQIGGHERSADSDAKPLFFRPLFAAAAGLVFGVFCTSALWAASESGQQTLLSLLHESFESGPPPQVTGVPLVPGVWSGDYSEVVTELEGAHPLHGEKMLRFLRADYDGKETPVGYNGDLNRVIDLRNYESELTNDDAVVSVEAAFSSLPFDKQNRFQCGITIYALSNLPSDSEEWKEMLEEGGKLNELSLATAQRWLTLSPSGNQWQKGSVELRIPPEAQFLVIGVHMSDRAAALPNVEPPAVGFEGHFMDDLRVSLVHRPSEF